MSAGYRSWNKVENWWEIRNELMFSLLHKIKERYGDNATRGINLREGEITLRAASWVGFGDTNIYLYGGCGHKILTNTENPNWEEEVLEGIKDYV